MQKNETKIALKIIQTFRDIFIKWQTFPWGILGQPE
jgi:hypothetical protein